MHVENRFHVWMGFDLFKSTLCSNLALLHDDNLVCQMNKLYSMSYQYSSFIFDEANHDLFKDCFTHMSVQG